MACRWTGAERTTNVSPRRKQGAILPLLALRAHMLLALLANPSPAAQPGSELQLDDSFRWAAGAGTLVGAGYAGPFAPLATLHAGQHYRIWLHPDYPARTGSVAPLSPRLLAFIRDGEPIGTWLKNEGEAEAYCEALIKANRAGDAALAKAARHDLTYSDLFGEPARYRGEVVHLRGRLAWLRKHPPPSMLSAVGIDSLYEGWVFDEEYATNPWCVLFTRLPAGVTLGDGLSYSVALDGYFFKRYRFKARDSTRPEQGREVPLVIGASLIVREPPPAAPATLFGSGLVPLLLCIIGGIVVLALGLAWWFRRNDRKVRERLAAQAPPFVDPQDRGSD